MNAKQKKVVELVESMVRKVLNESTSSLDAWEKLMDKYDVSVYREFQKLSESDLAEIRNKWETLKKNAWNKLNKNLRDKGISGGISANEVSNDELYPYLDDTNKLIFFKYSRMLDFEDGFKPKKSI